MVGEKEVVSKPITLAKTNKFKGLKPKVIEGKETEAKISVVETEAPKTTADQPIEVPQIPANLSKDCTDFSLKDLLKPLRPMDDYSIDFVKGTSCLVSNIGDAELKIDASDQGNLEIMQQDSKEMVTVDEVVEIEKAAYQNYKAEVMTVTLKESYSQVHVACLSKVLLPTPTFQDIDFVIPKKFNGSIDLVGVSLSSLLPQMKKQKSHYIIWFYKALLPQDKGSPKCFIWETLHPKVNSTSFL